MGKDTGISWTDHTFNPWWGCTKVSAGCDHCYAEAFDKRVGGAHWGKGQSRRDFGDAHWAEPLAWDKAAEKAGKPAKVFCASMADVMDDEAPEGQRERLWALIDQTPHLIWQLLTKRPQRYSRWLPDRFKNWNVWLGTSTEDQANYDLRWPILAAQRERYVGFVTLFVSYEPALGPLTLRKHAHRLGFGVPDWIICGGESGASPRPMEQSWAENLRDESKEFEVDFWMKQMSAATPAKGAALIPSELLIRQLPGGAS
jgi:protein gp37